MANLIGNGSMIGHADGWWRVPGNQNRTAEFAATPSRHEGAGCLSLPNLAGQSAIEVAWRPGRRSLVALGELEEIDAVLFARCADDEEVTLHVQFADSPSGANGLGLESSDATLIDASSWTEVALRNVAVPAGATHAHLFLASSNTGVGTIYVTDVYLGEPDGDDPPYPAAEVPDAANFLVNGTFEADLDDWWEYSGWLETIERDTVAPLSGTGSLKVTVSDDGSGGGVSPFVVHPIPVAAGEELVLSFTILGTAAADLIVYLDYLGADDIELAIAALTGVEQDVEFDVTVPAGAHHLQGMAFITNWNVAEQAVVFSLDDVHFGFPIEEEGEEPAPTDTPATPEEATARAKLVVIKRLLGRTH